MKTKLIATLVFASAVSSSFGIITLNSRNFTSPSSGLPLLGPDGNLAASGSYFYQGGTFSDGFDFNQPVSAILDGYTAVTTTGDVGGQFDGLFNSQTTYDGGDANNAGEFTGQNVYLVVGDDSDIGSSSLLAIFDTGEQYIAGDEFGNGAQTANAEVPSKVVYGNLSGEPSEQPGVPFSFSDSVTLVNVPEPSVALLGLISGLGLLRRRRRC